MSIERTREKTLNWSQLHDEWFERSNKAKVTVMMPIYDRGIELERAILSVIHQEYKDWDLLILGDRCKELTEQIALKYQEQIPDKIIFFNLKRNNEQTHRGTEQKNFASEFIIRTPYTAYLDDDNCWYPKHLSTLISLIEEEKLDFVYGGIEDRSKLAPHTVFKYRATEEYSWKARRADTSSLLHKSELIPKYTRWRERAKMSVDLMLTEDFIKKRLTHKGSSLITVAYFDHPKHTDPTSYGINDYYAFVRNQVKQQKSGVPING